MGNIGGSKGYEALAVTRARTCVVKLKMCCSLPVADSHLSRRQPDAVASSWATVTLRKHKRATFTLLRVGRLRPILLRRIRGCPSSVQDADDAYEFTLAERTPALVPQTAAPSVLLGEYRMCCCCLTV